MRPPRPLLVLLGIFVVLALLYSVTTPLFEAPDEQWHFAFVQHVAQGRGLPEQALPLQHLARQEGSQPPLYYALAAALTFWIDTSNYPAMVWENPHYGFDVPGVVNDNKNLFIHTAQENFPYAKTALAMRLARLLSIAMGVVAVYFTYRITALVTFPTPNEPSLKRAPKDLPALAAAALVAFTPQFLFISSAVSNDSTIVALCAVALFLLVRVLRVQPTLRDAIVLGIVCGLCALAKVSGLAMLPLAVLVIAYASRPSRVSATMTWRETSKVRTLVFQQAALLSSFALVAGWWYLRNFALYGEITGTARMIQVFGGRVDPLTIDAWRAQLWEVFETFWVGFGWGNIRAPEWVYVLVSVAALLAVSGLALGVWRARRHLVSALLDHAPLLVLAAWTLIVFAALLRWMVQTQAPHGRLLFPALPALAPLLVIGWMQLVPVRARTRVLSAVSLALFLFALLAPFVLLAPAYAYPVPLSESEVDSIPSRVDIRYGDSLMLLGSRVTPHPTDPRGALQVDLYWRVLAPMSRDYSLNLSALDRDLRVVGLRNTYPGRGTLATSLMTPGQLFHDTYWLPARAPSGSVQVSVFERESQQNLDAFDPAGNEITPIVNTFSLR